MRKRKPKKKRALPIEVRVKRDKSDLFRQEIRNYMSPQSAGVFTGSLDSHVERSALFLRKMLLDDGGLIKSRGPQKREIRLKEIIDLENRDVQEIFGFSANMIYTIQGGTAEKIPLEEGHSVRVAIECEGGLPGTQNLSWSLIKFTGRELFTGKMMELNKWKRQVVVEVNNEKIRLDDIIRFVANKRAAHADSMDDVDAVLALVYGLCCAGMRYMDFVVCETAKYITGALGYASKVIQCTPVTPGGEGPLITFNEDMTIEVKGPHIKFGDSIKGGKSIKSIKFPSPRFVENKVKIRSPRRG